MAVQPPVLPITPGPIAEDWRDAAAIVVTERTAMHSPSSRDRLMVTAIANALAEQRAAIHARYKQVAEELAKDLPVGDAWGYGWVDGRRDAVEKVREVSPVTPQQTACTCPHGTSAVGPHTRGCPCHPEAVAR
jgi:hypothetical protein